MAALKPRNVGRLSRRGFYDRVQNQDNLGS